MGCSGSGKPEVAQGLQWALATAAYGTWRSGALTARDRRKSPTIRIRGDRIDHPQVVLQVVGQGLVIVQAGARRQGMQEPLWGDGIDRPACKAGVLEEGVIAVGAGKMYLVLVGIETSGKHQRPGDMGQRHRLGEKQDALPPAHAEL